MLATRFDPFSTSSVAWASSVDTYENVTFFPARARSFDDTGTTTSLNTGAPAGPAGPAGPCGPAGPAGAGEGTPGPLKTAVTSSTPPPPPTGKCAKRGAN